MVDSWAEQLDYRNSPGWTTLLLAGSQETTLREWCTKLRLPCSSSSPPCALFLLEPYQSQTALSAHRLPPQTNRIETHLWPSFSMPSTDARARETIWTLLNPVRLGSTHNLFSASSRFGQSVVPCLGSDKQWQMPILSVFGLISCYRPYVFSHTLPSFFNDAFNTLAIVLCASCWCATVSARIGLYVLDSCAELANAH